MKIDQDVMEVLAAAEHDGTRLALGQQLDRKLYAKTDKVLQAIGFKWNRNAKAHVAVTPVADILDQILLTGEYTDAKKEFEAFYTPSAVADLVIDRAGLYSPAAKDFYVLEPSAGQGALAVPAAERIGTDRVFCCEKQEASAIRLRQYGFVVLETDFLTVQPGGWTPSHIYQKAEFDRIIMNPPFSRGQDAQHVMHALKFLKPGGRLLAIMSAGVKFRQDGAYRILREFFTHMENTEEGTWVIEDLPAGAFKESGTGVNTVLVTIDL